ncbi:MAG: histidine kinase [Bacteroidales bacterium]|jgi:sensor histidine kinase YesM|nr:histidine kinase [Bacteroidales bacterium]MCU0408460.1 histidine kinase [Bacteroidales bacterium]
MKKSLEISAHLIFWLLFVAMTYMLSSIYLQAKPDAPFSGHFGYVIFLELVMGLIFFYITFFGYRPALKSSRNMLILVTVLVLLLIFFALPAFSHGMLQVLSSLIPHLIVIFLAIVFRKLSDSIKLEKEKQELLLENTRSELALLKMQISPHFLFNTLNNIDYLISRDPSRASICISRLGSMLRYMIYDARDEKIPLSSELSHIEDYIELIRLRAVSGDYLEFNLRGDPGNLTIAPMLFIPLIENASKHAARAEGSHIIGVTIEIENKRISFAVRNEFDAGARKPEGKGSGIGLNLVGRRLELLYPGKYDMKVDTSGGKYYVELTIALNDN